MGQVRGPGQWHSGGLSTYKWLMGQYSVSSWVLRGFGSWQQVNEIIILEEHEWIRVGQKWCLGKGILLGSLSYTGLWEDS